MSVEVLWQGASEAPPRPRPHDGVLSGFGALAMLLAAAFCTITIWTKSPMFVTLYGVMVFCFGAWFAFVRRVNRRRGWRQVRYQITSDTVEMQGPGRQRTWRRDALSDLRWVAHKRGDWTLWARESGGASEPVLEGLSDPSEARKLLEP